jgi:RNA polymerase sigma-70 factor (ECF subfamily)
MAKHQDFGLETWIADWGDALYRYALTYTRDPHDAQDIAQETFWRLYLCLKKTPDQSITPGWLFTTARNLAVDRFRRRRREIPQRTPLNTAQVQDPDLLTAIDVATVLDSLSDQDRECLIYFYFAEWSVDQIATALKIQPQAVRTRLVRARRRFRERWEYYSGRE